MSQQVKCHRDIQQEGYQNIINKMQDVNDAKITINMYEIFNT